MQTRDFDYDLPPELIAQHPLAQRSASRLLYLPAGSVSRCVDRQFEELPELLQPGDVLVLNDTRVFPARLFGHKASGGRIEILIERLLEGVRVLAHLRASRTPRAGSGLILDDGTAVTVTGRRDGLFELEFAVDEPLPAYLERAGRMPLPPYIDREPVADDSERYQTVYANKTGAVAAPTAGLHFDEALFNGLESRGVERCFVTLHVGAGTFQPVRAENIEDHVMHAEQIEVPESVCQRLNRVADAGGRVIAVGTTVVRSLETAAASGRLEPYRGETDLFITPGARFNIVDALITNFHLPRSSLLMLVTAFGGYERVMHAYRHAVEQRYRFFSYGDAMYIEKAGKGRYKRQVTRYKKIAQRR